MTSKEPAQKSIGLFDSGVGGLTVLKALRQALPQENIVYFGDTARVPYGGKSRETILRYSIENSIFLFGHDIKLLVVACHTAAAYSIEKLQQIFSIPVIGVVDAGIDAAVSATGNKRIAVLGTQGTIASCAYQEGIKRRRPDAEIVGISCPLFVPLVEEQFMGHQAARLIVKEYLAPLDRKQIDTVLLGCTHYPLLGKLIQEEVGVDVRLVDPAVACAKAVAEKLSQGNLLNISGQKPETKYFVSDDPCKFQRLAALFLGEPVEKIEKV